MTKDFGKGFDISNLKRKRHFNFLFQKPHTLSAELSWSYYILFKSERSAYTIELDTL